MTILYSVHSGITEMRNTNVSSNRNGKLVEQSLMQNQKMSVIQFAIICALTIISRVLSIW